MTKEQYDYDFVVIGGGSGGMAAAKLAASYGARTALLDFVKPTTHGTSWGLGGTCVNVGCVPKKLMHYAGLMHPLLKYDLNQFGWDSTGHTHHDWQRLVEAVQNTVKRLNFTYRSGLRASNVTYINGLGRFVDKHVVEYTLKNGEVHRTSSDKFLIAVGGRPTIPQNIPGAQMAITSDDIFSLKKHPGKVLVSGGSYIALECAGFLTEIGCDVTVIYRSIVLRAFDRQCAEKIEQLMFESGTKFLKAQLIQKMEKTADDRFMVITTKGHEDIYDTVLFAVGRTPDTSNLGLENIGLSSTEGKLNTVNFQTEVDNIYAVGDCVANFPELTPVAIKCAEMISSNLFGNKDYKIDMNNLATTVFTPTEYGCAGLSEEKAIQMYGEDDIEVYHQEFMTLEYEAAHREKSEASRTSEFDTDASPNCLSKLVCVKSKNEKVVGFHFVGPNAGEVTQGFSLALRLGATKKDFDECIGIHPTNAESFMNLSVTKRSGENYVFGGCGGGKCG